MGVLRTAILPHLSFAQDPVRLLRAVKWIREGYRPTPDLAQAMLAWHSTRPIDRSHIFSVLQKHFLSFQNDAKKEASYIHLLQQYGLIEKLGLLKVLPTDSDAMFAYVQRKIMPHNTMSQQVVICQKPAVNQVSPLLMTQTQQPAKVPQPVAQVQAKIPQAVAVTQPQVSKAVSQAQPPIGQVSKPVHQGQKAQEASSTSSNSKQGEKGANIQGTPKASLEQKSPLTDFGSSAFWASLNGYHHDKKPNAKPNATAKPTAVTGSNSMK
jgi:hypothetical protein